MFPLVCSHVPLLLFVHGSFLCCERSVVVCHCSQLTSLSQTQQWSGRNALELRHRSIADRLILDVAIAIVGLLVPHKHRGKAHLQSLKNPTCVQPCHIVTLKIVKTTAFDIIRFHLLTSALWPLMLDLNAFMVATNNSHASWMA